MDPLMGLVGAAVISRWSYGLMRETGGVLLDCAPNARIARQIRDAVSEVPGARIQDLHVWRLGPGHYSAIIALTAAGGQTPSLFKQRLCHVSGLSHVTVEVNG
jgi:Co/Zn/Cd efflux system component